jgi:Tol biopolymer transport system component
MKDVAEFGAYYAEEIFDELKVRLNFLVTQKIPLIFYNTSNHFQQTNTTPGFIPEGVGGFFEFMKGRVVLPYSGSLSEFRHVIRHEIVHVFMTTKIFKVLRDHRLVADRLPPLWFVEGLAEYYSTEVDAQANMVIRDAVINNYFVGLQDMYRIYGSYLMYKEGQNFLEYVEEKYGAEKVLLLLDNFWMYNDFEELMEYVLGKKIEEIDRDWQYYLKKKYYPLLQTNAPPAYLTKKLTNEGFNFSPVYYKKDERNFIYFLANRNGYSSIYRLEPEDYEEKDPELVLQGERSEELEAFHLFQSSIDISENGELVFVSKSGGNDVIHFFSLKDEEIIRTFNRDFLISISSPKFSYDSKRIIFSAVDQKGYSDIFIYEISQDSLYRLTNDIYDDRDPVFVPAQDKIIFSSDRTSGKFQENYNLFSLNLENFSINYLTYLDCNNYNPVVSSDGSNLYFTSDKDGVRNIWKLNLNQSDLQPEVEKVTSFLTSAFFPSLISNSKVIFSGFENFSFNLYELDLNNNKSDSLYAFNFGFGDAGKTWMPYRISGDVKRRKYEYEKEYTLDYAQSQITTDPIYGTRGGAVISLSDLLGDDQYFFLIYNTAEVQSEFLQSFNVALERVNLSKRANYGYGIFNFSGRRYDLRDVDEYYFERNLGGYLVLNFPLSKFTRLEAKLSLANSDKEVIRGVIERKALLLGNSISYVFDNSLWSSTGPIDGIRARLLLGYTGDIKYSNVNYFSIIADYRQYIRLGLYSALALRASLYYNEGKEARRYIVGGSWDLRGWPRWSIRGQKVWVSSIEFRFPLIDEISFKFPFLDIGFWRLRGALFYDMGNAWDDKYTNTLGSVGFGFRINLWGIIVLRYDMGKRIENGFKDFQKGMFYQFFFGWDF